MASAGGDGRHREKHLWNLSFSFVERFTGPVQLKGVRPRTVEVVVLPFAAALPGADQGGRGSDRVAEH